MGTKVRSGGQWVSLENNISDLIIPTGFDGSWSTTSKVHNTFYTNTTGKLIYVSATFRVATINNESTVVTAGSSAWIYVSDPGSTSTTLSNYTQLGRVRDNGTADAENIYLNTKFFVPNNCKYIVKLYKTDATTEWGNDTRVSTLYWKEFEVNLVTSTNIFDSRNSNSNNFNRSLKAPSSNAESSWTQFMKDFAVWHTPGNTAVTGQTYSTTYTINITVAGDYILEYSADNLGNITFDGSNVASNFGDFALAPGSITLSNLSVGTHTLVASIINLVGAADWDSNPAGIAFGDFNHLELKEKNKMSIKVRENGQWKNISTNTESIPTSVNGTIVDYGPNASITRVANTEYTNNLGNLIQVSVTIGIDRDANSISESDIAGSYLLAKLIVSTNPIVTLALANVRDNGNQNTEFLFLNAQFFVPAGSSYILNLYDSDNNDWSTNGTYPNAVETFTWTEVILGVV